MILGWLDRDNKYYYLGPTPAPLDLALELPDGEPTKLVTGNMWPQMAIFSTKYLRDWSLDLQSERVPSSAKGSHIHDNH